MVAENQIPAATSGENRISETKTEDEMVKYGFKTLQRQREALAPPTGSSKFPELHELIRPHLESFDAIKEMPGLKSGRGLLDASVSMIDRRVLKDNNGNKVEYWLEDVVISRPRISESNTKAVDKRLMPSECRERGISYEGRLSCRIAYRINNGLKSSIDNKFLGMIPIMVKSNYCHLRGMSPAEMVKVHEEAEELGGYFIINGNEKLIRLLIVNRRNHPLAIIRPSFTKRGKLYTNFGVMMRSVREDQSSQTCTIHYLTDGSITFRFSYRKQEYMVPLIMILKALIDTTDKEIFMSIVQTDYEDTFVTDRVELMLRAFKKYQLFTRTQCLAFLGSKFRATLDVAEDMTDVECGQLLLDKVVLVHLPSSTTKTSNSEGGSRDKFNLLIFMVQKLYALVAGKCAADNPDSLQQQEVLLGGFLYNNILKEKLEDYLGLIKTVTQMELRRHKSTDLADARTFQRMVAKTSPNIGKMLNYFLATGNLVSNTGLDLSQASGYTIVAEKLNYYRYLAHFRSIHRGSFFAELKTTTVRKLLPESWGFMCPVHTPDGSPCGLLNHLAAKCEILTSFVDTKNIKDVCISLGMESCVPGSYSGSPAKTRLAVLLDGQVIGYCTSTQLMESMSRQLRHLKVTGKANLPLSLEIGYVPVSHGGQYPGLFLFSQPAKMQRPVKYLHTGQLDLVSPFEQVYMDIACLDEDVVPAVTTHQEYTPTNMLSVIASLTPFSDFNQSPRNMYQCQMGKQSMGTPATALNHRTDNKMYRLVTGQTPIVRPKIGHSRYNLDGYPNGTNAVVAVISYTGYDMEDAMIINKSAYERGFGHGLIYKSEFVDLGDMRQKGEPIMHHFGCPDPQKLANGKLDYDGLPLPGTKLTNGDPYYSYVDDTTGKCKVVKYKGLEDAIVDDIRICGAETGDQEAQKINIKLRIPRNPVIGDKFSSRHGQKGVCSQKYPVIDLPFTESGMVPDVIINPHAFPSRMTIGMFVESMAAKAGALHGFPQDATPFQFGEDNSAVEYFGDQLKKAGYNYYGNEPMYSGITGREMNADIYIGVVYYQRLRHMVSDKYQVRTTGPIDSLTHQPVKGRKRAGGIRFGEMERDSLLAHGASFCLQDRLMNCSDYSLAYVCKGCGSLLSPLNQPATTGSDGSKVGGGVVCKVCEDGNQIDVISIPYVFRYLATELLAMNIKLTMDVREI